MRTAVRAGMILAAAMTLVSLGGCKGEQVYPTPTPSSGRAAAPAVKSPAAAPKAQPARSSTGSN